MLICQSQCDSQGSASTVQYDYYGQGYSHRHDTLRLLQFGHPDNQIDLNLLGVHRSECLRLGAINVIILSFRIMRIIQIIKISH